MDSYRSRRTKAGRHHCPHNVASWRGFEMLKTTFLAFPARLARPSFSTCQETTDTSGTLPEHMPGSVPREIGGVGPTERTTPVTERSRNGRVRVSGHRSRPPRAVDIFLWRHRKSCGQSDRRTRLCPLRCRHIRGGGCPGSGRFCPGKIARQARRHPSHGSAGNRAPRS
ncbi:hypothetical protein JOE40_000705 [Arthrobacter sp. PvP102]|nr:hypothetical protein [Arthrobacter sp. PvP103]MBP1236196.1 hypothetical protein [Arthrobacter sp. PvP102]